MHDKDFRPLISILWDWFISGVVLGGLVFAVAYTRLIFPA